MILDQNWSYPRSIMRDGEEEREMREKERETERDTEIIRITVVVDSGEYFVLETLIPEFYRWLREKRGWGRERKEKKRDP